MALVRELATKVAVLLCLASTSLFALPAYVSSQQYSFVKTNTDPSTQTLSFSAAGGANSLVILGSFNSSTGFGGITAVTDNGGNTWFSKTGTTAPDPDFWYTLGTNSFTSVTVTYTDAVTVPPWSSTIKVMIGAYSGFNSVGNVSPNGGANNTNTGSLTDGVHPYVGFVMFYDTSGAGVSVSSSIGTVRQQVFGVRDPAGNEAAGMALIDDLTTTNGIGQTLSRSVFWLTVQAFKNFSSIPPPPTSGEPTIFVTT